jgi:hypothetical protein
MEDISTSDYSISEADFSSVHRPDSVENLLSALVGGACDEKVRSLPLVPEKILFVVCYLLPFRG